MKQAEVSVLSSYPVKRVNAGNAVRSVRKIRLTTKRRATAHITAEYLVLNKSRLFKLAACITNEIRLTRCLSNTNYLITPQIGVCCSGVGRQTSRSYSTKVPQNSAFPCVVQTNATRLAFFTISPCVSVSIAISNTYKSLFQSHIILCP